MSSNDHELSSDDSDADYVPSEKELQKCKSLSEDDSDDNVSGDEKSSGKRSRKSTEFGEKRNKLKAVPKAAGLSAQPYKPIVTKLNMPNFPPVKKTSGLAAALSSLNKKSKPTVFEQSRQDWNSFKQEEGISETLATYNKGKDGYLERQDFLQRTDLRLFEKEKDLRSFQRSKK